MILFSAVCIGLGVWPEPLYAILPFEVNYVPYTGAHVVEMLQLLLFSGLAFFLMLPFMKRTLTITLDWDWFYRRLGPAVLRRISQTVGPIDASLRLGMRRRVGTVVGALFRYHGPKGILARTWATGSMVLWVAVLLGLYLIFYYAE